MPATSYRLLALIVLAATLLGASADHRPRGEPAPSAGYRGPASGAARALLLLDMQPLADRGLSPAARPAQAARIAAAQAELAQQLGAAGVTVLAPFSRAAAGLAVQGDPARLAELTGLPGVLAVLPIADYALAQGDPAPPISMAELSALIGADEVRRRGADGSGIDIAIIDTGADYSHARLGGSGDPADYRRAACGSPDLSPGDPGCAPPATAPAGLFPNAKLRGGYDFVGDTWPNPDPVCPGGGACRRPDANPIDLSGHGTHVADIIAGLPQEPGGADAGVAPGASLWVFKACNGPGGLCEGVALLQAIDAALDLDGSSRGACLPAAGQACQDYDPADIINLSISYSYGQPEDALSLFADLASSYGSLVVAAAGDDGATPYIIGAPASAAASLAVAESLAPAGGPEQIAGTASRGPRIADSGIKPDLAAPGAIISAQAGSGAGLRAFAGSSGAAPVASGVAAMMVQILEQRGIIDPSPGLNDVAEVPLSAAPVLKALLMNTAGPELLEADGSPAALSRQGAGRIDALAAFTNRVVAWDATPVVARLSRDPDLTSCTFTPYIDLFNYRFFGIVPPCAAEFPFGDELWRAWNSQAGSVSFGYQASSEPITIERQVVIFNYSLRQRSYNLSASLRDPAAEGVSIAVSPASLTLDSRQASLASLTLTIDPARLPAWPGGACDPLPPELSCPGPLPLEVAGDLIIDGGPLHQISLPWQVLPRRSADLAVARALEDRLILSNGAASGPAAVEPFALLEISPNQCDSRDGLCGDRNYSVGQVPGSEASPVDIQHVGVRGYSAPGLNGQLGLPAAPAGATPDEVVEFAVTVYDRPYRATPNAPARFEVTIDSDRDGVADYLVYNAPGADGRSMVFVRDLNPADGSAATRAYLPARASFNTASFVLPAPAAALGLRSDRPFSLTLRAYDASFGLPGEPWDCSPGSAAACGAHTVQTGDLRFAPLALALEVPAGGRAALRFREGGGAGSPSQIGLLLLSRDGAPGAESAAVRLP